MSDPRNPNSSPRRSPIRHIAVTMNRSRACRAAPSSAATSSSDALSVTGAGSESRCRDRKRCCRTNCSNSPSGRSVSSDS